MHRNYCAFSKLRKKFKRKFTYEQGSSIGILLTHAAPPHFPHFSICTPSHIIKPNPPLILNSTIILTYPQCPEHLRGERQEEGDGGRWGRLGSPFFISENENMCVTVFSLPTARVTTNTHVLPSCTHDRPRTAWTHSVQYKLGA